MKHRLFIASSLPLSTCKSISKIQEDLQKLKIPLNYEPEEKLHLTFSYLGKIEEEFIPQIQHIITKTALSYHPINIQASYIDSMYNKHGETTVYLGLGLEIDILKEIYKTMSKSISLLSIPQPERFFPHITIAKFQKSDPVSIKSAMDKISDYEFKLFEPFYIDNISLFESLNSQKGSYYRLLAKNPIL